VNHYEKDWRKQAADSDKWFQIPMGWKTKGGGYGMWSGLSLTERILFLPFYLLETIYWCLSGKDVHWVPMEEVEN